MVYSKQISKFVGFAVPFDLVCKFHEHLGIDFFGKSTPFVKGPAKAALTNKTAVLFAFIHKPRRGYYEGVVTVPELDLDNITEQELTIAFVRYLENVIRQYPEMWLWSHRRWKWEWKPEYGEKL